ncbi:hypothetical protein [Bradyrhizobium sp. RD5-C2]|uniref:hypothetical protein n=1 Tax=Bradyrhizobium sp. RD5-C2 TaxID=244562 RepID=UPI001CC39472|nr:hypothetical protein [Bradyrhizobium sp. RD5-C2]GIQ73192.1 hypothetical protein BraRD5C2_16300 [Bradyrhizobium sp. RD5-C2]
MTPDDSLDQHRRMIGEVGETIVVRRRLNGAIVAEVETTARVMGYQPREIAGMIQAGDRKVIALVDTLAALLPLTAADKLVIRNRECAIKSVDDNTRRIAGVLIALEIQAAG